MQLRWLTRTKGTQCNTHFEPGKNILDGAEGGLTLYPCLNATTGRELEPGGLDVHTHLKHRKKKERSWTEQIGRHRKLGKEETNTYNRENTSSGDNRDMIWETTLLGKILDGAEGEGGLRSRGRKEERGKGGKGNQEERGLIPQACLNATTPLGIRTKEEGDSRTYTLGHKEGRNQGREGRYNSTQTEP
jgi:hypothetical protein